MKITIDRKTLTINHLYWHKGNMKILTTEARKLREYIKKCVKEQAGYELIPARPLKVEIKIHENWLTKDRRIKKKDVENRSKFLLDSIFKALDIDDKFIFDLRYLKIQDEKEEKAIITIEPIQ